MWHWLADIDGRCELTDQTMVDMQAVILLGRSVPSIHVLTAKPSMLAAAQPASESVSQLYQGFASLQQRVEALAQALAAHGINL